MRKHATNPLILAACLLAGACAPIRYDVQVDAHERSPVPPAARVSVVAASHDAPWLGTEIEGKIERLLEARGFRIAPGSDPDSVDVVVLAAFGAGQPPKGSGGAAVVQLGNLLPSVPEDRAGQARWLIVAAARPSDLESTAGVGHMPWLWYATTFSSVTNGQLDQVIDYLLVPTFEWFGRNTGSRVDTPIQQRDPRVRALSNPPDEE